MDQKEKKEGDNDEFDMFAQSRNATYEKTKNRYYILSFNVILWHKQKWQGKERHDYIKYLKISEKFMT